MENGNVAVVAFEGGNGGLIGGGDRVEGFAVSDGVANHGDWFGAFVFRTVLRPGYVAFGPGGRVGTGAGDGTFFRV